MEGAWSIQRRSCCRTSCIGRCRPRHHCQQEPGLPLPLLRVSWSAELSHCGNFQNQLARWRTPYRNNPNRWLRFARGCRGYLCSARIARTFDAGRRGSEAQEYDWPRARLASPFLVRARGRRRGSAASLVSVVALDARGTARHSVNRLSRADRTSFGKAPVLDVKRGLLRLQREPGPVGSVSVAPARD